MAVKILSKEGNRRKIEIVCDGCGHSKNYSHYDHHMRMVKDLRRYGWTYFPRGHGNHRWFCYTCSMEYCIAAEKYGEIEEFDGEENDA